MTIGGVIIAGGRSTRMGGEEKAFAKIGGRTILQHTIDRLRPQLNQLAINANGQASRYASYLLPVFGDHQPKVQPPLAGLHAALHWAKELNLDWLLTAPSDAPFLPIDLVARLAEENRQAAIAASGGQSHYLTGLWSVTLLGAMDTAIESEGIFRVKDWVSRVDAAVVEWPAAPFDPFFNINTPEELAEARLIAASYAP